MKKIAFCLALALSSSPAWAVDNSTTTYNGGTHNLGGTFTFPSPDGTNNTLQIIGGALVYNTQGILGDGSTANTNFALISGAGSTWSNASTGNSLFIGNLGSGNQLTVSNSGTLVSSGITYIGNNSNDSTDNQLHLVGSGSSFVGSQIYVGNHGYRNRMIVDGATVSLSSHLILAQASGAGNLLVITNGGKVSVLRTTIGGEGSTAASNNTVIVTGAGSMLTNSEHLFVGRWGPGNRLEIRDQAVVVNEQAFVGASLANASNSSVLVTGSSSVWSNRSSLYLGNNSASNSIVVADSARLYSADLQIGNNAGAVNNLLLITNGGQVRVVGQISMGESSASAGSNTIRVAGGGSLLQGGGALFVGRFSADNSLFIESGATNLVTGDAYVGNNTGADNNQLRVSGAGAAFTGSSTVYIGNNSRGNSVTVADGASLTAGGTGIILGNSIGSGNTMIITNGGRVITPRTTIGGENSTVASNNTVIVTGSGSVLSNTTEFTFVGRWTPGNRLEIRDGGVVYNAQSGRLGANLQSASNNTALVTGSGSVWHNADAMIVGVFAASNAMTIADGGKVISTEGKVGEFADAANNFVHITDSGSIWQNSGAVSVGSNGVTSGTGGRILVTNGGTLDAPTLRAGFNGSGSISNVGGVYQFATVTPTIHTNTQNGIYLNNGTISYRDVTAADISNAEVAKIQRQGDNTFQLKRATNVSVSTYTFDSVANTGDPFVYQKLALAEGSRWQSTTLRIGSGGALIGNGTVASSSVTNLGTIAPGFSAGQLTFTGDLVLGSSSTLEMEIGGASTAAYDQLIVLGDVTLAGALDILMINSFSPTPGQTFTLIDNLGANLISGQFAGLTNNQFIDASANGIDAYFRIQYNAGTGGNDLVLLATVPEPSALLLVFLAGVAALARRRR